MNECERSAGSLVNIECRFDTLLDHVEAFPAPEFHLAVGRIHTEDQTRVELKMK